MKKGNVSHFLKLYKLRLEMQENGITNPPSEIKEFTKLLVEKLSKLSMEDNIKFVNNKIVDSNNNLIAEIPYYDNIE